MISLSKGEVLYSQRRPLQQLAPVSLSKGEVLYSQPYDVHNEFECKSIKGRGALFPTFQRPSPS